AGLGAQLHRILDPLQTAVRLDTEWLDVLAGAEIISLAAKGHVARMLEHPDLRARLEAATPIGIDELLYPLAEAYGSVVLEADVELAGAARGFDLDLARAIMTAFNREPQLGLRMPLLPGVDGAAKMSSGAGNAIGVDDPPGAMFRRLSSVSDD